MFTGTLLPSSQEALAILGTLKLLSNAYLAGGSALALQLGHRRSYDFDFFTPENVQVDDIAQELSTLGDFITTELIKPHTLLGTFNTVKFSIFRYNYPLLEQTTNFHGVQLASVKDIAAMKLTAIGGRATKRDYIDMYILCHTIGLDTMLTLYEKKFGNLGNNLYVTIKALGYFEDAEDDDMPQMLIPLTWEDVKSYLIGESDRLAKKYMEA